ncbi:MAG: hypothetical protein K2W82_03990 [Candidatus Obscuribacterales bacterium]|nr:hypothetical protein [Candidatus Obscuribacterales bacterium]
MAEPIPTWVHQVTVFADNFQFHIQDATAEGEYPETLNDDLITSFLALGDKVVAIGTVRDLDVEVTIEIFDEPLDQEDIEEEPDTDGFDQVAQCNIDLPSGRFFVAGPVEDIEHAKKIEVKPGSYGMRIFWKDLHSVDTVGFEGDDSYRIMMWPDTEFEPRLIKMWKNLIQLDESEDD